MSVPPTSKVIAATLLISLNFFAYHLNQRIKKQSYSADTLHQHTSSLVILAVTEIGRQHISQSVIRDCIPLVSSSEMVNDSPQKGQLISWVGMELG
jgi:hypothetical protein